MLHVTLHAALREVYGQLSIARVHATIGLLGVMMQQLGVVAPRLGVAALNPHAGDNGLFGDEEKTIIRPAIEQARGRGIDVTGPFPADTLFVRAAEGEFDGLVAMYHDQGHIALKLLGWREAGQHHRGVTNRADQRRPWHGLRHCGPGRADPTVFWKPSAWPVSS